MNSKELVSVIMPVYNVQNFLKTSIDSILIQTYNELEIILVDDGSTDNCSNICDSYEKIDKRIKVIHKKNGGLSSARNEGIKNAHGNYIMFVDSDDWIERDMIASMMNKFTNTIDIVCCGKIISKFDSEQIVCVKNNLYLSSEEVIEKSLFDHEVGIAAWGKIFRKSLFENIKFPDGEIHEDAAIMFQIFDLAKEVCVLNKALYYYRYNAEGISKSNYSTKFDVVLNHNKKNEKFILQKYPKLYKKARAMVAYGCYSMMLKIIKTENGYEMFHDQYIENKKNFKERFHEFNKICCNNLKDYFWIIILMNCNCITIKFLKKLGIAR